MDTPTIEPASFVSDRCAQAVARPIAGQLRTRLIVNVDVSRCGRQDESYIARHEMCHFRMYHHEILRDGDAAHGDDFPIVHERICPSRAQGA